MRLWLMTGLALTLAACGGGEEVANKITPTPTPTPPPMLGGVNLNQPLRASGTGPYWQIDIAPGTIAYSTSPEEEPTDFYPVSPKRSDGRAVFETQTPEAAPVTIALIAQDCVAGKASLPLAAEAKIGARTFKGCAGPTPRPVRKAPVKEGTPTAAEGSESAPQP